MINWKEKFNKKFIKRGWPIPTEIFNGDSKQIKDFIRQTILNVLDEAVGKKIEDERELMTNKLKQIYKDIGYTPAQIVKMLLDYKLGYNQKRQEILDLKNKLTS